MLLGHKTAVELQDVVRQMSWFESSMSPSCMICGLWQDSMQGRHIPDPLPIWGQVMYSQQDMHRQRSDLGIVEHAPPVRAMG